MDVIYCNLKQKEEVVLKMQDKQESQKAVRMDLAQVT